MMKKIPLKIPLKMDDQYFGVVSFSAAVILLKDKINEIIDYLEHVDRPEDCRALEKLDNIHGVLDKIWRCEDPPDEED